jgi:nucleoside-diphosphate-sugar epimerase
LFIGGTGLISSAVSPLVVARGHDLTLVNRGQSVKAAPPTGASVITADAHDATALRAAVAADVAERGRYDAVVQWICFTPDHVRADIETFRDLTDQYVFISSASAYETPPSNWITTERTPLSNPFWSYSADKIACEQELRAAGEASGFPFTIVRPSHTYGYPDIPFCINSWTAPWTIVDRLRRGEKILVHGDGSALWTLTDHRDFAVGLEGLLGKPGAIGEDFTITSDDVMDWNQIHGYVADAISVSRDALAAQTVYVPTDVLARFDADAFEGPIMGDKRNSAVFDTSKLRSLVPEFDTRHYFRDSIRESIAWFEDDEPRRRVDTDANALWDRVIARYEAGVATMFD